MIGGGSDGRPPRDPKLWMLILIVWSLAFIIGGLVFSARSARGDDRPVCTTPEACHFLDLAMECRTQHRITQRELEGERRKVRTSSVVCGSLTCAPPLPCPACECGGGWVPWAGGAAAGALAAGAICALAGSDGVTVVR